MASQHIEGVLDALKAKLQTTVATNIAAVNADAADDLTIDAPDSDAITIGVRADLVKYPWIMLLPERSVADADLGTRVMWRHRVRVVTWLAAFSEEELARKLIRVQRAVRECLLKDRIPSVSASSTAGWALHHVSDEYGPCFRPDDPDAGDFVQAASSVFEVQQQQDLA